MNSLAFTVPGRPIPQGSVRVFRGRVVQRPEVIDWRLRAAAAAQAGYPGAIVAPITDPVTLWARFYLPRPLRHYGATRALKPWAEAERPGVRPDLDKLTRALCDALVEAGILEDDALVVSIVARKAYGSPPRSEVRLLW